VQLVKVVLSLLVELVLLVKKALLRVSKPPSNVCPATGKRSLRVDMLEAFHKPLAMVSTARARNKPLSEEALCKAAICT
jgi:hypothetical protein